MTEHTAEHLDYTAERAAELIGQGVTQSKAWRQANAEHRAALKERRLRTAADHRPRSKQTDEDSQD